FEFAAGRRGAGDEQWLIRRLHREADPEIAIARWRIIVKQTVCSIAIAIAIALAAAGCTKRERTSAAPGSAQSQGPLELKLPLFPSGELHDLAKDRGSVVLLDVWATWCEPCRDALPVYQRFLEEYGPRGLKVYAINVDEDSRQIAPFVRETK